MLDAFISSKTEVKYSMFNINFCSHIDEVRLAQLDRGNHDSMGLFLRRLESDEL